MRTSALPRKCVRTLLVGIAAASVRCGSAAPQAARHAKLAAELGPGGSLKQLGPEKRPLIRREEAARFPTALDEPATPDSVDAESVSGRIELAAEQRLLSCPGDFVKKEGFSKPMVCPTKSKMKNCSWSEFDETVGEACDNDCFCEPPAATMNIELCKKMCKYEEPCFFTYSADFGCRVYSACDEGEAASGDIANSYDWITCNRFFQNYSDVTVALHNSWFNRYIEIDENDTATKSHFEVELGDTSVIVPKMWFVVTNTSNVIALNAKGKEDVEHVMEEEAREHAAAEGRATAKAEGTAFDETAAGPGIIALYNSVNGNGQHWLTMDDDGNLKNMAQITENAMFTVCYQGPQKIALHNAAHNRYIAMDEEGLSSTKKRDCCKIPDSWHTARFTVVTVPTVQSEPAEGSQDVVSAVSDESLSERRGTGKLVRNASHIENMGSGH